MCSPKAFSGVEFTEDFESGGTGWSVDNGVWEIGTPTSGPSACHSGSQCAGTVLDGNYPAYGESRLVGAGVQLPSVTEGEEIHLRFQNWLSYSSHDSGQVQISVWDGTAWGDWENVGVAVTYVSGGWSLKDVDLTTYAGQRVRLGFLHHATRSPSYKASESKGWYIDDIEIVTTGATNHPPALALINDQSVNESDTLTIPLSATDIGAGLGTESIAIRCGTFPPISLSSIRLLGVPQSRC